MKRLSLVSFLILATAILAHSQASPNANGIMLYATNNQTANLTASSANCSITNACLQMHLPTNAAGGSITIAGTFVGTAQFEISGDNQITWPTNIGSATAPGLTLISVAGITDVRVRISAYTSGTITATINVTLNNGPAGPPGPAGSAGVSGSAIALGNTVVNPKIASTYNYTGTPAFGDTQQVVDAICTNGTAVCTSATANWTSADVGKSVFIVLNAGGGITTSPQVTTIASVQSAIQMTMTGILTGGACTGTNCTLTYGHDDTLAIKTASDFAKVGGAFQGPYLAKAVTLYVPKGGYLFSNKLVDWRGVTGNDLGPNLVGDGVASTVFFPRPDVNTADHFFSFRGYGGHYQGFSVEGSNMLIGDGNDVIFWNCSDCSAKDIRVNNFHNSSAGGSDLDVRSTHMSLRDVGAVVGASVASEVNTLCRVDTASDITWEQPFCSNGWRNLVVNASAGGSTGSHIVFVGGDIDECADTTAGEACTMVTGSKDVSFITTGLISAQNGIPVYALFVDGTSEVRLVGNNVGCFGSGTGCNGANGSGINIANGGKVWATEAQFRSYGTGFGVNGSATASFFDLGGNCYGNNANAPCAGSTGVGFNGGVTPIFPLASGATTQLGQRQQVSGTVPTFAVTGFGGAGLVVTVQTGSTDAAGAVVVTAGAAPAASGTLTLTFSTGAGAYGTNPPVCGFTLVNGTGSWNALAQQPVIQTPTTTSVIANWADNSVALTAASTYGFNWNCYGK